MIRCPNGQSRDNFNCGIPYVRTAVMDGNLLKVSGSIGFDESWNRACARGEGRDITPKAYEGSEVLGASHP
jgi:hypothetical protein